MRFLLKYFFFVVCERFILPEMTVQVEEVVAHVSVRVQQTEPDFLTSARREYRCLRIATNDRVCKHVGEVEVTSSFERSFRCVVHAFPDRFSTVVDCFLTGVFSIFRATWTSKIRHRAAVCEPHVDVGLELDYELTERSAIGPGDGRLRS